MCAQYVCYYYYDVKPYKFCKKVMREAVKTLWGKFLTINKLQALEKKKKKRNCLSFLELKANRN